AELSEPDVAEAVAERICVLTALATLPEADRELLTLVAWHGLKPNEAAQVVGCSTAAYFVRLHRARRRLERAMADPPERAATEPPERATVDPQERPAVAPPERAVAGLPERAVAAAPECAVAAPPECAVAAPPERGAAGRAGRAGAGPPDTARLGDPVLAHRKERSS